MSHENEALARIAAIFEKTTQMNATLASQNAEIVDGLKQAVDTLIKVTAAEVELITDASNKPIGSRKVL